MSAAEFYCPRCRERLIRDSRTKTDWCHAGGGGGGAKRVRLKRVKHPLTARSRA